MPRPDDREDEPCVVRPTIVMEAEKSVVGHTPSLLGVWTEAVMSTVDTIRYVVPYHDFWHNYGGMVGACACIGMLIAQPREVRQSMSLVSYMTIMSASAAGGHFFGKFAPLVLCSYAGIKLYSRSQ